MNENELAHEIVDGCFAVHQGLGPGLLESAYEAALCHELTKRGLTDECQKSLPVIYDNKVLEAGYRLDVLVCDLVILEIKSVEHLLPLHKKQLLTYLRLSGKKLGLLVNFNVPLIRDGITRIVNGL